MIPLATFPPALLRLILCGGGGLPPAWGPLIRGKWYHCAWHPESRLAFDADGRDFTPMQCAEGWEMSCNQGSPWPARLAMVAAWMVNLGRGSGCAVVYHPDVYRVWLEWCASSCGTWTRVWETTTGKVWRSTDGAGVPVPGVPSLPTLPTHLATLPPEAALVLALHDLPEVAARVAAAVTP